MATQVNDNQVDLALEGDLFVMTIMKRRAQWEAEPHNADAHDRFRTIMSMHYASFNRDWDNVRCRSY
jgi:hypothetical protein